MGHGSPATNTGLHMGERTAQGYFAFYGNDYYTSAGVFSANVWYHLTFVYVR